MADRLNYKNKVPVAGHRGNAKFFPENTMASFRSAASLGCDMIETDLHMTSDKKLVLIHDHTLMRTAGTQGLVREKTLAELRRLDAGIWKSEEFENERIPTFEEFLDFFRAYPDMLFNLEFKDYPADSGDFAFESADLPIKMAREAGILERSVINTWSGELNERLVEKYGDEIRIHAYSPQELMGKNQKRFMLDYAYCVCLFGIPEKKVAPEKNFKLCAAYGVEPWVYIQGRRAGAFRRVARKGRAAVHLQRPRLRDGISAHKRTAQLNQNN
jgi:glycerophosphoryl diester phosphodiesterase